MAGQDAKVSVLARDLHFLRHIPHHHLLWSDDLELKSVCHESSPFLSGGLHLLRGLERFFNRAFHVEGLFWDVIILAFGNAFEALHCIRDLDVASLRAGKLLGHMERLRKELLYLTSPRHRDLLVFAQFVNTKNRD